VSVACLRDSAGPYELRAVYAGNEVTLFRSGDLQTFGQVKRALQRSIEIHGEAE